MISLADRAYLIHVSGSPSHLFSGQKDAIDLSYKALYWSPDAPTSDSLVGWDLAERGSDVRATVRGQFWYLQTSPSTVCSLLGVRRDLHSHGALVSTPVVSPEAQGLSAEGERLLERVTRFTAPLGQVSRLETEFRRGGTWSRSTAVKPAQSPKLRSICL